MSGRRFFAAFGLTLLVVQSAGAQVPDSTVADSAQVTASYYEPPRFAHDRFFLGYAARFSAASSVVDGDLPGRIGLEEYALADRLPGVAFRRNGVPYQAAEYAWSGGDGQALGVSGDRTGWYAEPLGYPPYGANDPLMLPGPSDTVFLQTAPLLGYTPAGLNYWRDPTLPDSAKAVARYINGPLGYSAAGGRFRGDMGRGWEFDGQFYNVLSDGAIDSTAYAGHSLDIELRHSLGRKPLRVRFRQNRGQRAQSFRWESQTPKWHRSSYDCLLSHLDFEFALPSSQGEWLLGWQMRQEDQKKWADSLLVSEQRWFSRSYELSVSRLWQGRVSGWVRARGRLWDAALGDSPEARRDFEIEGGVVVPYRNVQITVTAAGRTINILSAEERVAAALAWQLSGANRLLVHVGVSKQQPSDMRFWLPAQGNSSGYSESGDASLPVTRHQTASLTWQHHSKWLQFDIVGSAGSSRDLAVWQPAGDTATSQQAYVPVSFEREFATVGFTFDWQPFRFLTLRSSLDRLFRNDWNGDRGPVFAPNDEFSAALLVPLRWQTRGMRLTPQVHARGAAGGRLPDDYVTLAGGLEFQLKQFVVYWFRENIVDLEYRTGGAEFAYSTHSRYGFRWELWN